MKKSYLYFLVPLVLTAIFAVYYWQYASGYDARLAAIDQKKKEERQQKLDEEAKAREKAIKDALALAEKRKAEKKAKEEQEAKEAAARELAIQERNKAQQDARKYADQVKRLQKDVQDNKDEIAKTEEDKKQLVEEQGFLRDYVKKAEVNVQSLQGVLEKIDAADKARAAAEAAAAKKSS